MANGGPKYRRGSILGALVLITIGGLFLYGNINPQFPVWTLLARFWPIFIIFWGLSKLADYLMHRGTPEAAEAARLRGGEIFGLIMLVICGTLFSQAVRGVDGIVTIRHDDGELRCLFQSRYDFPAELTEKVELPATLSIHGIGNVTIQPSGDDEVRLVGRKTVCASTREDAQEIADIFQPSLEKNGRVYDLHWRQQAGTNRTPEFDIELFLPATMQLDIATRRGDISISDHAGDVKIKLNRGELRVEDLQGNLTTSVRRGTIEAENIRGDVSIEGSGEDIRLRNITGKASVAGQYVGMIRFREIAGPASFKSRRTDFRAESIPGEAVIDGSDIVVRNVPGEMFLKTRDKDIELDEVVGPIEVTNRNGPVTITYRRPPTKDIKVTNRRGRIELLLPARSGFNLDARNEKGDIKSDFTEPDIKADKEGRRTNTLEGKYGPGGPTIDLQTSVGDIRLRRVE